MLVLLILPFVVKRLAGLLLPALLSCLLSLILLVFPINSVHTWNTPFTYMDTISKVMTHLTRRQFGVKFGSIAVLGTQAQRLFGASTSMGAIDQTLREGIDRRKIPCVAAMVASQDKILYSGAFGKRDSASGSTSSPIPSSRSLP